MFSKQYKARIESFAGYMTRIKREEKKACAMVLVYDFDEELAQAIGGAAPEAQALLARSGESPCKVKNQKLVLDSKTVRIIASAGKADKLTVERTANLTATARRPTAQGGTDPVLTVKAAWQPDEADEADGDLAFLLRHMGTTLKVRMDRQQLELPSGTAGE